MGHGWQTSKQVDNESLCRPRGRSSLGLTLSHSTSGRPPVSHCALLAGFDYRDIMRASLTYLSPDRESKPAIFTPKPKYTMSRGSPASNHAPFSRSRLVRHQRLLLFPALYKFLCLEPGPSLPERENVAFRRPPVRIMDLLAGLDSVEIKPAPLT
jgi:hypothetical protein